MISTQVKHLWIHSVVCFSSLCICGNLSSTKDVFVCCLFLKYYFEKILQCCFSFGCLGNSNEKIFQAGLQYWFLYNWFIFIILIFIYWHISIRLFSGRKKMKNREIFGLLASTLNRVGRSWLQNMKYKHILQGRKEYKYPGMEVVASTGELRKESIGPSLIKIFPFVDVCSNVLW